MASPDSPTGPAADAAARRFDFVVEQGGERLDLLVARQGDLSRTQAATLIATGQVVVNGRREKASYRGEIGDRVEVTVPPPPGRDIVPEQIPLDIVFEDEHLLVVDKPAGMVVHPAPGNWTGTLVNALMGRGEPLAEGGGEDRAGLVHRLDKDTSGLLVVAKTDASHRVLSSALAARRVTRRYVAVCWGHLSADTLTVDQPLARDPRDRTRMAIVQGGKAARTDFVRLARFDSVDLLRAHLHSGRTHQIRVHLASVGHPVIGDDTYGGGGGRKLAALPPRRHFLHAAWLRFVHPVTGGVVDLRSPLPPDLRHSLAVLSGMPELESTHDPLDVFGFYQLPDGQPG
ncbi:MAG: RluA family pseudouridine synthase [Gemmatimonadaceae bacterium]|jgi:23S rRNA pseudouridine1911/1915/1917 synthase|nr:RluA family pseudouridine synthase [Gemmatimonadaceae bacterium]